MKLLHKVMTGLTTLFIGSTALCGFSLLNSATAQAISFHVQLATATLAITLITIALLANSTRKAKV